MIPEEKQWVIPCDKDISKPAEVDTETLIDTSWRNKRKEKKPEERQENAPYDPTLFPVAIAGAAKRDKLTEGSPVKYPSPVTVVDAPGPSPAVVDATVPASPKIVHSNGTATSIENDHHVPTQAPPAERKPDPLRSDEALRLLSTHYQNKDLAGVTKILEYLAHLPFHPNTEVVSSSPSSGLFLPVQNVMSSDLWISVKQLGGDIQKIAENLETVWMEHVTSDASKIAAVFAPGERREHVTSESNVTSPLPSPVGTTNGTLDLSWLTSSVNAVTKMNFSAPSFTVDPTILSSGTPTEVQKEIGRIGEQLLFTCLTQELASQPITVVWVNQDGETKLPYDILLTQGDGSNTLEIIEVKTTTDLNKELFEISAAELLKGAENPTIYSIYLLYLDIGTSGVSKILRLSNVWHHLRNHDLSLYLKTK